MFSLSKQVLPFVRSIPKPSVSCSRLLGRSFSAQTSTPPVSEKVIHLPTNEESIELLKIRHTSAHVMAMAVQKLFPDMQVAIGPWIDNGFYYDFFSPTNQSFCDADLKTIKNTMVDIIKQDLPMRMETVSREEARSRIESLNEPFKLEILDSIKSETITIYHIGDDWWDLCAGPHLERTGELTPKAIDLQTVAGAYWRGDEKRPVMQRIYGTAWESAAQLKSYKTMLVEAKKRDHRILGKKLDLFSIQEEAGGGLVLWHPKGSAVRNVIESFWKSKHIEADYDLLYTPHVASLDLWKTSGHFDFYSESMFDHIDVEGSAYQLKPMNCPLHCLMFKDTLRSYRDLPLRWAELGTVYRYERSGTLHGLMRVRGFTQDDAHIFCLPSQLTDEIIGVLDLTEAILSRFGFNDYEIMISTRPEKSVGSDEIWEKATSSLVDALQAKGWAYKLDEGGGAFYGPKIDIKIRDAIGRLWQCSTIQCDFNLPERFDLQYVSDGGDRKRPIMVHRAIFGSIERFFGVLLESTGGSLPLWLAPVQLRLLPVTDSARPFCEEVTKKAKKMGLRVETANSNDRIAKLVRTSEQQRIPLMAIVGDAEIQSDSLSIRSRKDGDLGLARVDEVLEQIKQASMLAEEVLSVGSSPIP